MNTSEENAENVMRALKAFGAPLSGISKEDFQNPGVVFQMGIVPRRIDVITSISGITFEDAWPKRQEIDVEGLRVSVISREHLIRNKKSVGRPQDLADAARLEDTPTNEG